MEEILKYLKTLRVEKVEINLVNDTFWLYFEHRGLWFSPYIKSGMNLNDFKKALAKSRKDTLKNELLFHKNKIREIEKELLIQV